MKNCSDQTLPGFRDHYVEPARLAEPVRLEDLEETFVPKDEAEVEAGALGPTGLKNPFWS